MEKSTEKIEQTSWMQNRLFPTVGDLLAMLGIFFAVQIAVTLIGTLALLFSGRGMVDLAPTELGRFLALTSLVSLSATALLIWRYRRWRQAPKICIALGVKGLNPLLVVWCFALMMAASVVLEPLYELLPVPHQNFGRGGWAFMAVVVIAPLFEEWICRGLIFGSLRSRYGVVRSMVLSALVFGLMHVQPVPVLNAFVLGLVLAFIYHKTNSLWSSVILHALYNGTAYLLTIMGFEDQSFRSLFGDHTMGYATFYGAALILFVVSFFAIARVLKTAPKTPLQEGEMGPSAQKITPVE